MDRLDHVVSLILGLTILAVLAAVAWYILSKLRNARGGDAPNAQELLERFGKLYEDGEISREEYRAIRTIFADSLLESSRATSKESDDAKERNEQLETLLRSERR